MDVHCKRISWCRQAPHEFLIAGDTETASVTVTLLPDYCHEYILVDSHGPAMLMMKSQSSDHWDSSTRYMLLSDDFHLLLVTSPLEYLEAHHQRQLNLFTDVFSLLKAQNYYTLKITLLTLQRWRVNNMNILT